MLRVCVKFTASIFAINVLKFQCQIMLSVILSKQSIIDSLIIHSIYRFFIYCFFVVCILFYFYRFILIVTTFFFPFIVLFAVSILVRIVFSVFFFNQFQSSFFNWQIQSLFFYRFQSSRSFIGNCLTGNYKVERYYEWYLKEANMFEEILNANFEW